MIKNDINCLKVLTTTNLYLPIICEILNLVSRHGNANMENSELRERLLSVPTM